MSAKAITTAAADGSPLTGNDITRPVCSVTNKRPPAWTRLVNRLKERLPKTLSSLRTGDGTGVCDACARAAGVEVGSGVDAARAGGADVGSREGAAWDSEVDVGPMVGVDKRAVGAVVASPPQATANTNAVTETTTAKKALRLRIFIEEYSTRLIPSIVRLSLKPGAITIAMVTKTQRVAKEEI